MTTIFHNINGLQIGQRREDGYINATAMCVAYGKDVSNWLKTDNAWELIVALAENLQVQPIKLKRLKSGNAIVARISGTYPTLINVKRGLLKYGGGIWIHYKLAIPLAIWINAELVPLVSDWVENWLATYQYPNQAPTSQQCSSLAKVYIESSQTLNRTIHTEIHRQTNSLRLALEALERLEKNHDLTFPLSKSVLVSDDSQTNSDGFIRGTGNNPHISTEKVLEKNISNSPAKKPASGRLYKYTKDKTRKSGVVASYPCVKGERDADNLEHWYWAYSYEVLENGKWKGRSLSISRSQVAPIQAMIDNHRTISEIKSFIEDKSQE